MRILFAALLGLSLSGCANAQQDHAVILLYHHVSDETPPSTSVTPEQFERHLDFLAEEGFRVWPLERTLEAVFDAGREVPPDVVSITFDDAYESVRTEAMPRLRERGWPFTVFVNTDAVDAGHAPYMSWDELRALHEAGVALGNHSAAHGHMSAPREGEGRSAWRARVTEDLERAHERLRAEIGIEPVLFAYPYGEDSPALAGIVSRFYEFALVQRSGAVGPLTDPLAVPRFPMATGFSSLDRLGLAVRSRPLPVRDVEVEPDGRRGDLDRIRMTLAEGGYRLDQLQCFSGAGVALETARDDGTPVRVTVDVDGVGTPGRNKVNCTAPADDGSGEFYWYAHQWRIEPR